MKRDNLENFIKVSKLLTRVQANTGIYAITIDDYIVYIGQSVNMYERCSQHIYNMENAMLIKEQKYLLLLSAKLGGHRVDCHTLELCSQYDLSERELKYIKEYNPILNIQGTGKYHLNDVKIEDVLKSREYKISMTIAS